MTGLDQNRQFAFKIPRGLPGVNALDNDAAVATYLGAEDSASRGALLAAFAKEGTLTPYHFGALPPTSTTDNTAALTALFQAARGLSGSSGGARVYLPAGTWVYNSSTPLPLASNVIVEGASIRTVLLGRHASAALFSWTSDITGVAFRDMRIVTHGAAGHVFNPVGNGGVFRCSFENLFVNVEGPNAHIWLQETNGSYIQIVWRDCELQRTVASLVPPFKVVNGGGAANFNLFDNTRLNGYNNQNTPFMHIESTLAGAYAIDWTFLNVLGEQNPAGLIHGFAAFNWTFINVTDEDSNFDYNGHFLALMAGTVNGLKSRTATFMNCGRRGRPMTEGKDDIYVDGGRVSIIGCNPSTTTQQSKITVTDGRYFTENTLGYPERLTGTLHPEGNYVATIGSTYIRRGGGAGTTLYVKESASGSPTGWVAK